MKKLITLVFLIILITSVSYSQKETYNWNFGYGGALTFNTPDLEPEFVYNSKLSSWEGCATISDKDGKLLFYAHGNTVWNKNNEIMDNGDNLAGHSSSTQSCVAFRAPNQLFKYYIFTVDAIERNSKGFNYSIVDLSMNNGLGKVVVKNVNIHPNPVERLTVIPHANKTDYWVIVNLWQKNEFLAYHVSELGVSNQPVSSFGTFISDRPTGSVIKPSLDGKILASAHSFAKVIELFDFDDYSGKLTIKHNLRHDYFDWPYGVEFSPDNKILYAALCTPGRLVQFDLTKETTDEILNSMTVIGNKGGVFYYGSLQLGPNGKIYVAQDGHNYLGVINRPNILGVGCNFSPDGFLLQNSRSGLGLPTFVQASIIPVQTICNPKGNELIKNGNFNEFLYDFNSDLMSLGKDQFNDFKNPGSLLISNKNPLNLNDNCHLYNQNNNMLHAHTGVGQNDIVKYKVNVERYKEYVVSFKFSPLQNIAFTNLSVLIDNKNIVENFVYVDGLCFKKEYSYSWIADETKEVEIVIRVTSEKNELFSFDDISFKSCDCSEISPIQPNQYEICYGSSIQLKGHKNSRFTYKWTPNHGIDNDSSNNPIVNPLKTTKYYVSIIDTVMGCFYKDSINVIVKQIENVEIIGYDYICFQDSLLLKVENEKFSQIVWSNGIKNDSIYIKDPGLYKVTCIDTNGCIYEGNKEVFLIDAPDIKIIGPKEVCINEEFDLTLDKEGNSYLWSDGQITRTGKFKGPGKYSAKMFISENCFSEDSIEVALKPDGVIDILGSGELCKGQSIVLQVPGEFASVEWNNGEKDDQITVSDEGAYSVVVIDKYGCRYTGVKQVILLDGPEIDIVGPKSVCLQEKFNLSVNEDAATYLWSDGQVTKSASFSGPGTYKVQVVFEDGCVSEDSITILKAPDFPIVVEGPEFLCIGMDTILNIDGVFEKILWSNGSTSNSISISEPGVYLVEAIDSNGCNYLGFISIEEYIPIDYHILSIDLGTFCISETQLIKKVIQPNFQGNTEISNIYTLGNFEGIQLINSNDFPIIVNEDKVISFNLKISPKSNSGIFYDTIAIETISPCYSKYLIPIHGKILETTSNVWLQDTLVEVGSDFCIPVFAEILCDGYISGDIGYSLDLIFNSKIFIPKYCTSGAMNIDKLENSYLSLKLIDTAHIKPNVNIINYICGTILLPDSLKNQININDFEWIDTEIPVTKQDGSITVDYCQFNIRHLDLIKRTNIRSIPNISNDIFEIEITSSEIGNHTIDIVDLSGVIIKSFSFNRESKSSDEIQQILVDTYDLPQGLLLLKLSSPWSVKIEKVLIMK